MTELIEAFGRELVNARNFKGITLDQISEVTRIQRRYLEAMETGQWDILPQPYMEAFLKAYAEMVGMNVPKVMKMYRDVRRQMLAADAAQEEAAAQPIPTQPPGELPDETRPGAWVKYTAFISLAIIAIAAALILLFMPKPEPVPPQENEQSRGIAETGADSALTRPAEDTSAISDSIAQPSDSAHLMKTGPESPAAYEIPVGVNLLARSRQRCWLRAIADKESTREVLLAPGDSLVLRANQEIELLIGNAGGLELEMNGESLGALGPEGRAVTIVITPDGIQSQRLGRMRAHPDASAPPQR